MAALRKYSFFLRDFRFISYHRQNQIFISKLCIHTAVTGNSTYAVPSTKNVLDNSCNWLPNKIQKLHTCTPYFLQQKTDKVESDVETQPEKMTLFQRFKAMYRDYWYVLVPVHVLTSAVWFGGFYYAATSGIDIVAFVEKLHLSETIVDKIRSSGHSTAGYLAISYALYKIFTPVRYTVTLAGTTISINYLKKWGYIKPIPKKEELKKILSDKRHSLREKRMAFKDNMIGKLNQKKS